MPPAGRPRDPYGAARHPVARRARPAHRLLGQGPRGRPGEAAIVDDVVPDASGVLVCTWRYSAFFRSDLDRQLRMLGRDQIVVCGVYAHLACTTTAVDAFSRNLEVFLAADAVADFSAREHRTALEWAAGCCAAVRTTEELTGLLRSSAAGHLRPASTVLRSGDATVPGHVAATPSRPDEVPRSSTGETRPATILTCTKTMHERTGR
ncbi:isochorismatase family protein [Streptomyces peucetius]|nr:hypothetical protein CGZ69_28090 [Streptomyces peucetius subsp. caesius ATCC 27952]